MFKKQYILLIILIIIGILGINTASATIYDNETGVTLNSTPIKTYNTTDGQINGHTGGKSPGIYITDEGDNKRVQTIAYKKVKSIKVTTNSGKVKIFHEGIDFNNTKCKNGYFLNLTLIPHTWGSDGSPRILILYGDWINKVDVSFYNSEKTNINKKSDIAIIKSIKKGKYCYIAIKNKGPNMVKSNYLGIYSKNKLIKKYYIPSLKSGQKKILKIKINRKYLKKQIKIKLDYTNRIKETNELNNIYKI